MASSPVPFGDLVTEQVRALPKRIRRRTVSRVAYRRGYARALYALRDQHPAEFAELLEACLAEATAEEHADRSMVAAAEAGL